MKFSFGVACLMTLSASALQLQETEETFNTSWNWHGDSKNLPDGDHITLSKSCGGGVPRNSVRIGLYSAGDWWKGIVVHSGPHHQYDLLGVAGNHHYTTYATVPKDRLTQYTYTLSKAKNFGVHTDMYKLSNIAGMQGGCTYTFRWIRDWA